jgi:tRNA(fMet)-specific endonuclease VapC
VSFLLDTNICSAHLKQPSGLTHRFVQHSGRLYISTIVLGELYTWALRRGDNRGLELIIERDLLPDLVVLDFDLACAAAYGALRNELLRAGTVVNPVDLMIAAVALVHDLTLVTHNTRHFEVVPGLRVVDWLEP